MLNAERLSVLALVREAIVENQVNAESKHISMVLSLNGKQKLVHVEGAENAVDRDDVFINADHETIKTAVKNLVENAINYSPEHTTAASNRIIQAKRIIQANNQINQRSNQQEHTEEKHQ